MANPITCSLCSSIPSWLRAQTGIDERFPEVVYSLKRFDYDRDDDIYRCPECNSLFRWEDWPQFYGSGNLDKEILTRFSEDEAAALRALLDLQSGFDNAQQIVNRAFEILPADIVNRLLARLAIYKPIDFHSLIDLVVDHLVRSDHSGLRDVLTTYCGNDPGRISHVIGRIEARPHRKGSFAASALLVLRNRLEPEPGSEETA